MRALSGFRAGRARGGGRGTRVAAVGLAAVLAAGCSLSVEEIPLPGGADLGDRPYTVKAQFEDALSLVPQAAVKVNDVAVGRVEKVSLPRGAWYAEVTLAVNGDVRLPANAIANLEQSSLLGEKYIKLSAPAAAPAGQPLTDGATIPLARTTRSADTEEVFGALSMLLSGGGLPQIRTINRELNQALGGREDKIRSALENLNTLTSTLNRNRTAITGALDGLNRLSSTVAVRKGQVATVLTDMPPGLKVLEEQRGQLVQMLRRLEDLADVAGRIINASKDDVAADFRALSAILRRLADSGRDLPKALEVLFTYPFTDEVAKAIKGDYLNGYLSVVADPGSSCVLPAIPKGPLPEDETKVRSLAKGEKKKKGVDVMKIPECGPSTAPAPAPADDAGGTPIKVGPQPVAPADTGTGSGSGGGTGGGSGTAPPLPLPTLGSGG